MGAEAYIKADRDGWKRRAEISEALLAEVTAQRDAAVTALDEVSALTDRKTGAVVGEPKESVVGSVKRVIDTLNGKVLAAEATVVARNREVNDDRIKVGDEFSALIAEFSTRLASARAMNMEEAAITVQVVGGTLCYDAAQKIRALATLPSTQVALPRKTAEVVLHFLNQIHLVGEEAKARTILLKLLEGT